MEENKILNNEGAILTNKELEEYLEKVASNFNIKNKSDKKTYPIPRLIENYNVIKEVYNLLSEHLKLGIDIHPAGEWLLDNFYIIEESVKAIEKEVTLKKYINFVGIQNGRYEGLARIYVLAAEIINHTDSKINREALENYIIAYQKKKTLNMDEIWNIGLFMQIVIIENIRQISERIYIAQIEKAKVESIVERLVDNKKTSAQKFNNIKSNRILKMYKDMKSPFIEYLSYKLKRYGKKTESYLNILEDITQKTGSTVSEIIKKEHFDIALRKVSIGNCITSIKNIQRINFLEVFEKINEVEEILKHDPADVYDKMDYKTKESYRTAIKEISKETKISEIYISKKVLEIAKKYKKEDKRINIIDIENNGVGNARNVGIKGATGRYITFLDADDYIEHNMYEKIIKKMEETNVELLRCNFIKEDEKGNIIKSNNDLLDLSNKILDKSEINNKLLLNIFEDKLPTYVYLLFAKTETIKNKLEFRTDIRMMEDLIFCLELYMNIKQIYLFDFKCYHYVRYGESSTRARKNLVRNYYDTLKVIDFLEDLLSKKNIAEDIFSTIYTTYSTILIKYILRTFQKDDEYRISYDEMVNLIKNTGAINIMKNANFVREDNSYINTIGNYIKKEDYINAYEYALKIKDRNI